MTCQHVKGCPGYTTILCPNHATTMLITTRELGSKTFGVINYFCERCFNEYQNSFPTNRLDPITTKSESI